MEDKKTDVRFDLSSTILEKGIDAAKSFVDKLVTPSVEELGLLMRDQISLWRFNNQIKILNKAKAMCEKNGISMKAISPKLLCPYLENASLEDDEELQNKWAALLANMVDSRQNIQNHVFPYILSQLSKDEFNLLEAVVRDRDFRLKQLADELSEFLLSTAKKREYLSSELAGIAAQLDAHSKVESESYSQQTSDLRMKKLGLQGAINQLVGKERSLKWRISAQRPIFPNDVSGFEMANIIRLGLASVIYEASARPQRVEIPRTEYSSREMINLEVEVETESTTILTELGELFLLACKNRST